MKKLAGKVAVITEASQGIGEGIAKVYAEYGAKVVLAARSEAAEALAGKLRAAKSSAYLTGTQIVIGRDSALPGTCVVRVSQGACSKNQRFH